MAKVFALTIEKSHSFFQDNLLDAGCMSTCQFIVYLNSYYYQKTSQRKSSRLLTSM